MWGVGCGLWDVLGCGMWGEGEGEGDETWKDDM